MNTRIIPLLTIYLLLCSPLHLVGQRVIINEIMFVPESGEAEWVELWNRGVEPVQLRGWTIHDAIGKPVLISTEQIILEADSFLVLASSAELAARWETSNIRIVHVPNFPILNNGGDDVVIMDDMQCVVDSVRYGGNWGVAKGYSLERAHPNYPFIRENSASSLDPLGATPGFRNSRTPPDMDLRLSSITYLDSSVAVVIANVGLKTPDEAVVYLHWDSNDDGVIDGTDMMLRQSIQAPGPGDSLQVLFDVEWPVRGRLLLLAIVRAIGDEKHDNDSLFLAVRQALPSASLIVNEIMFAPRSGSAEWVEFLNISSEDVSVAGCAFARAATSSGNRTLHRISDDLPSVASGGYLLVASDSSVFHDFPELASLHEVVIAVIGRNSLGLVNSGDEVLLIDVFGNTVDSVRYEASWHHPLLTETAGRTLELINPDLRHLGADAWTTCPSVSGGTPGQRNAAYASRAGGGAALRVSPNPFSPDGDGHEDHCVISWSLPSSVSLLRLRIYDIEGRCIRSIENVVIAGQEGSTIWDGCDDAGRRARIGVYVILAEALDARSTTVALAKAAVVVATRL